MSINKFSPAMVFILATAFFLSAWTEEKTPAAAQTGNAVRKATPTPAQNRNAERAEIKKESLNPIAPRPLITAREAWKANAPKGEAKEHTIRYITIHHTATLQKKDVPVEKKMQNLQNFSQNENRLASGRLKPVWFDVPYHFYIAVDGKIAEGREIRFVGDTNTDYDPAGHALIVLEGNFETEIPSSEQEKSLQALVAWLAANYKVPASQIKAHNDYASTACPGVNLKKLLPALRDKTGEITKMTEKR